MPDVNNAMFTYHIAIHPDLLDKTKESYQMRDMALLVRSV
ncbi:hypothetical protein J2T13_003064 [Paenibacillus sp. DS2015]